MTPTRRAAVLALLAVAGCGFTPVYGPGGGASGLAGQIAVDPPVDAESYALVQRLEERLGAAQAPLYRLSASLAFEEDGLGVTPDQEITRFQIPGRLTYALVRDADGATVAQGTVDSFTAYSAPVFDNTRGSIAGNTVSVLTAQSDARRRLAVILADRLVARLLATASDWRGPAP